MSDIGSQRTDHHLLGLINLIRKWLLERLHNSTKTAGDVCIHKCPGTITIHKGCQLSQTLMVRDSAAQISNMIYDQFFAVNKDFDKNGYRDNFLLAAFTQEIAPIETFLKPTEKLWYQIA